MAMLKEPLDWKAMDAMPAPLAWTLAPLQRLRQVARFALDLIMPPACFSCRAPVAEPHALCSDCWNKISFLAGPECALCGLPFDLDPGPGTLCGPCLARQPDFDRARSVVRYDDASKGAILAFKRADRLDIVPAFARWLERAGRPLLVESDVIVPVPLHPWRLWRRRYNQAAMLAAALARLTNLPHAPLALSRTRPTPSQGTMPSAKARRRNVRGAFKVPETRRSLVAGKTVLLIDDVYTTGATLEACAKALKRGGAARVFVLTIARVVRRG